MERPDLKKLLDRRKRLCLPEQGEYAFPWWQFDRGKYCMQVLMGGLEGRYWLGSRKSRGIKEETTVA